MNPIYRIQYLVIFVAVIVTALLACLTTLPIIMFIMGKINYSNTILKQLWLNICCSKFFLSNARPLSNTTN